MERVLPWVAFWGFLGCCALALGLGNMNPLPTRLEIDAAARKEIGIRLAERGASLQAIQCVLDPPTFSNHCRDLVK